MSADPAAAGALAAAIDDALAGDPVRRAALELVRTSRETGDLQVLVRMARQLAARVAEVGA